MEDESIIIIAVKVVNIQDLTTWPLQDATYFYYNYTESDKTIHFQWNSMQV